MAGGDAWQGVVCMVVGVRGRGCAWQGSCMRGRRDGHCSERYASYWNDFLLIMIFTYF